jgi:Flp pilus assembly protein protease CpaA
MPSRKKTVSCLLVIIGIVVAIPFNYIYGIEGIEVDLVWVAIGFLMAGFGVYTLKKESKY